MRLLPYRNPVPGPAGRPAWDNRQKPLGDRGGYTFQTNAHDLHFVTRIDCAMAEGWLWDKPELDEVILSEIESSRQRADEQA